MAIALAAGSLGAVGPSDIVTAAGDVAIRPLDPARILETRPGEQTDDGEFEGEGQVAAGRTVELQVAGRADVPDDADAVMLNVTAVFPRAAGFLTVFPCGSDRPLTSNVNYAAGDVVPNAVLAKIGDGGKVCIYTLAATDILADVNGYVPNGGSLATVEPERLLETRPGEKTSDGEYQAVGRATAGSLVEVKVTGRAGIPSNADAVMLNVTAILPAAPGFLTVFPCGSKRPLASNVNYFAGDVVPNAVLAKVGTGGKVCIYTLAATDIVADVSGYVPNGGALIPVEPARFADSREGATTVFGPGRTSLRMNPNGYERIVIAGRGVVPRSAEAVIINLTAVNPSAPGFLSVYPCGSNPPTASSVNYSAGAVVANAVLAKIGTQDSICLFSAAAVDIVVDVNGYVPSSEPHVAPPDCSASLASQAECDALTAIYNSMGGPDWNIGSFNWGTDTDPCTWSGVGCSAAGVVSLTVSNDSSGPLPPEIGDLDALTKFTVNGVTTIPKQLGELTELTYLFMSGSYTTLPTELGNLTNLTELYARDSLITKLPASIGNLTELDRVAFDGTNLTTLPPEFGNLTKLRIFDAANSRISSLPVEIGNLTSMELFRMTFNQLDGDITAPFKALRDGAPGLRGLNLTTTATCPTVTDASVENWLDSFNSFWDFGCG